MFEPLNGLAATAFEAQRQLQAAVKNAITNVIEKPALGTFCVEAYTSQLRDELSMILEAVRNDPRVLKARLDWFASKSMACIFLYVDTDSRSLTRAFTFYY